jgi:hypothetical protein
MYVVVRKTSIWGNGRKGGPRSTDEDTLDLHQAFMDVKFELGRKHRLLLRAGRQEMAFGSSLGRF